MPVISLQNGDLKSPGSIRVSSESIKVRLPRFPKVQWHISIKDGLINLQAIIDGQEPGFPESFPPELVPYMNLLITKNRAKILLATLDEKLNQKQGDRQCQS